MKQFWEKRNEGYSLLCFTIHLLISILNYNLNLEEVKTNGL